MSTLRSGLDEVRACELEPLSDEELHEEIVELERASRVIEAERARRIAEAERRRSYTADGHLSMSAWLRHRLGIAASVASDQVRIARSLRHMPAVRDAFLEGEVSASAVTLLALAHQGDPPQYERSEEALLGLAGRLSVRDLRRAIEHWRQLADATHGDGIAERRFERRGFYASTSLDGMVRLDGDLDPETGQTVLTALGSVQDEWARSERADPRSPAQCRADALGEICRRYLTGATVHRSPASGPTSR